MLAGTLSIGMTMVKSESTYNYYGVFNQDKIVDQASEFIVENSNAELIDLEDTLKDFISITSKDYGGEKGNVAPQPSPEAAWFTIRMTNPTDEYTNNPRWHRDGRMYTSDRTGEVNSKYATTLLGNSTRIMKDSAFVKSVLDEEEAVEMAEYDWATEMQRQLRIAERLAEQPVIEVPDGCIIKFSWGQPDSPVHSEPDMSTDRVFISILYGSEAEMKDMCKIRNEDYRN